LIEAIVTRSADLDRVIRRRRFASRCRLDRRRARSEPDVRRYDVRTGALEHQFDTNYTGTQPSNNFTGGLAFDRHGRLFVPGFDREAEGNPGALLRFDGVRNRALPARHQPGAVFVAPSPVLARPIGVLALD
jgi:hypothetical protein